MPSALAAPVRVAGQMAVAALIAAAVAVVSLTAIARVEWPAYNSSNQLHALTTVGQVVCLAGLLAAGLLWRRGRRTLARLGAVLFLAAFSVVTIAMPLRANAENIHYLRTKRDRMGHDLRDLDHFDQGGTA